MTKRPLAALFSNDRAVACTERISALASGDSRLRRQSGHLYSFAHGHVVKDISAQHRNHFGEVPAEVGMGLVVAGHPFESLIRLSGGHLVEKAFNKWHSFEFTFKLPFGLQFNQDPFGGLLA